MIDDTALGDYQIVRPLGRGGMGLVFLGHDPVLDRPVAIKLIATAAPSAAARERFLIEARAIARLAHPNVVAVYRAGETRDGRPFLVQELVRGHSLDRLTPPLPAAEVRRIGVEIARGLAAAHRRGVLHRDLKPANVMIADDGTVKILDFGLAKLRPLDQRGLASAAVAPVAPPADDVTPSTLAGHHRPTGDTGDTIDAVAVTADAGPPAPALDDTADLPVEAPAGAGPAPVRDLTLTQPGAVLGTPRYMAPEQWRGEAATERTDLYALGAVLFELATGRPVYPTRDLDALRAAVLEQDPPALATVAPDVDPALAAVVDRALAREPAARPASADAMAQALATAAAGAPVAHVDNPYRGLAAFAADDRALFFGRGADVGAIVDRLRGEQAVVVVGDSGVGKSSLVRAGVLPAIAAGGLGGARAWITATFRPGADPLAAARAALGVAGPDDLAGALAAATHGGAGLVVFVDQAEELITQAPRADAVELADVLATALAGDPGLRVIASVRGDFVTRLADVPGLRALVTRGLHLVSPLDDAGRREAIVGPAAVVGVELEAAAVDALVAESAGRGGLPLLQFALALLWQRRDVTTVRITAADVVAIGGVGGALARHADGVIAALDPAGRATARRLLTALVTSDGTSAIRDAAELAVDAAGARAVLDALIDGRLVVARDGAAGASYALAHDALIVHWATLAEWLADDVGLRARRQRLAAAATEWARLGRGRDGLLTRRQLSEAATLPDLAAREAALVAASRRALARRRTLTLSLVALAVAAIVAAVVGTRWAQARARDRQIAAHVARAQKLAGAAGAQAAVADRTRADAFAQFDRYARTNAAADEAVAEDTWRLAQARSRETRDTYRAAASALESALLIEARPRLRTRLAELLHAQAVLAERDHDPYAVADLRARVATYSAEVAATWDAPATLTVTVDTPAELVVRCAVASDPTRRPGLPLADVRGRTLTVTTPPTSCLVDVDSPGRVRVQAPVTLARGERLALALTLPAAATAPAGFAYVAPGRFLFGAEPEEVRKALAAPPQHQVELPGFWIARTETTLAQWIEFLDQLAPAEREERRPRPGAGFASGVELTVDADGAWAFTLTHADATYRARRGAPFRYQGRARRVAQDWTLFPVAGITIADARAYAAWLDRTGRVRGARLCTGAEWERAARGADDRIYPHGDQLELDDADLVKTYGEVPGSFGPDQVGSHPASDSPFGVADLLGNVWEFVESTPEVAVTRGGDWYSGGFSSRSSKNLGNEPNFRSGGTGVRICADAR